MESIKYIQLSLPHDVLVLQIITNEDPNRAYGLRPIIFRFSFKKSSTIKGEMEHVKYAHRIAMHTPLCSFVPIQWVIVSVVADHAPSELEHNVSFCEKE